MMIRNKKDFHGRRRRGFTLIELAIVLAIVSLLFAGLWRLMASGSSQLRDQAAADQQQQLISAVAAFLATAEGQTWMSTMAANTSAKLPLPTTHLNLTNCKASIANANVKILCEYLPPGFTGRDADADVRTTNSYGQSYEVRVLKDNKAVGTAPASYSFMILTYGGDTIPDTSGGRIASLIGNDGGFIYSTDVCGSNYACGAFGSWAVSPVTTYGFSSVETGHVASRTFVGLHASQNAPWLARSEMAQSPSVAVAGGTFRDYNTLQSDLYFGNVASTASTATIYGAVTGSYGGAIRNLSALTAGRSTDTGNAPVIISSLNSTCPSGSTCTAVLQVNGSANVTDFLTSNKLYAAQFIYNTTSDKALKTDIRPLENILEKLEKIGGYSFTMKQSGEKKLGVIAQEVEKVFPELVEPIDSKYKGVDYMGFIGPLVAAVNELKKENDEMRSRIESLEAQMNDN